jgi:pimeloyl-ACP methyl ester carboxylesterase
MTIASIANVSRRAVVGSGAAGAIIAASWEAGSQARDGVKGAFVLVHPAWLGGWCWRKVTPLLRNAGRNVHAPTLTGLGERSHLGSPAVGLATHVEDVVNVLEAEDLRRVVLVGNSSGGMVIAGVADRAPDRIAHLVYLDAFVPEDGQSLVDLLPADRRQAMEDLVRSEGQGWLLPRFAPLPQERILRDAWSVTSDDDIRWMLPRLKPTPFRHFTDPFKRTGPADADVARTYVRCRQFQLGKHRFDVHAKMAQQTPGWRYRELATPHLPYVTHPAEVADLLLNLVS